MGFKITQWSLLKIFSQKNTKCKNSATSRMNTVGRFHSLSLLLKSEETVSEIAAGAKIPTRIVKGPVDNTRDIVVSFIFKT